MLQAGASASGAHKRVVTEATTTTTTKDAWAELQHCVEEECGSGANKVADYGACVRDCKDEYGPA